MSFRGMRIAIVGPLPPPAGGMANQTRQLAELLQREGTEVSLVRTNAPYRPQWIAGIRVLRAGFRLLPYVIRLWRAAGKVDLFHLMANSGWSWHLYAVPALLVGSVRGVPVVVNYRGGEAESFLARSASLVRNPVKRAAIVVPSAFLHGVFARYGIQSQVVPNVIDVAHFQPATTERGSGVPHLVVTRNLEAIYDIPTALRAFARVRRAFPDARLTVAGSGPERDTLVALANALGIGDATTFSGRLDRDQIAALYRTATVSLNPSRIDNMPNSVLEAMASGVPVVSTAVGGVPFLVRDGETGLLVAAGDHEAMADAVLGLLSHPELAKRLRDEALSEVQQYAWIRVRPQWQAVYDSLLRPAAVEVHQT